MENSEIINIQHIPFTINENELYIGALEIVKKIRPQWVESDIELKLLTDGITNKLVACKSKYETDNSKTVLVRVYGNKTDLLIDRKAEMRNIILLNKINLAPNLYAIFNNGLAYEYVPGCTLNENNVIEPHIYELVAIRMAQLHKVHVNNENNPKSFIWDKIKKFLDLVPDEFSDNEKNKRFKEIIIPKIQIQMEINLLKDILTKLDSPIVFSHNDLLLGNVIYTKDTNLVTFIDYEYAGFNYQAFDIGNHFAEFAGIDNIDYNKYPNKNFQLKWLAKYLNEYQGQYNEYDLNKLYVHVNKFVLLSHIFWGLWALIQAEYSYIDFDYLKYASIRFNEYFARKNEFLLIGY